jgi:hypothetical protein
VPDSRLIRFFKEACDAFWKEHSSRAGLIPGDKMSFRFYKADGTLWGQDHNMEADVIEVIGKGRYAVIDRALQFLRRDVNQSRGERGLADVAGLDYVVAQFRFETLST